MLFSFDIEQSLYKLFRKLAGIKKSWGKKKEINYLINSALIFSLGKEMKRWQRPVGDTVPMEKKEKKKKFCLSTDYFQYFTCCF